MKTEIKHKDEMHGLQMIFLQRSTQTATLPFGNWESLGTQIHQLPVHRFETVPDDIVKGEDVSNLGGVP